MEPTCESQRLGVRRVAARGCGFPDDSGIEDDDDVYAEYRGALTDWMAAETLRVRADIACVTYTCICTVTTARKWY